MPPVNGAPPRFVAVPMTMGDSAGSTPSLSKKTSNSMPTSALKDANGDPGRLTLKFGKEMRPTPPPRSLTLWLPAGTLSVGPPAIPGSS